MFSCKTPTPPDPGGRKARAADAALAFGAACLTSLLVSCSAGSKTAAPTAPAIATQPASVTVLAPAPASFTVTATGETPTYQWQRNGAALAGATSARYTTAATTPADDQATFTVTASNSLGSVTSTTATLHVNFATILGQPTHQVAATGETATFAVGAVGPKGGSLSYQWKKGGTAIAGATSATLSLTAVSTADMAAYTCAVTSLLNGTVTAPTLTEPATLAIVDAPLINGQPQDQTIIDGNPASFTVTAVPSVGGTLSYQWKLRNQAIPGATSATLLVPAVSLADEGSYSCNVTQSQNGGSQLRTSSSAFLTVVSVPVITLQPQGATLFPGEPLTLATEATGNGTLSYQWRKGGVNLPGGTAASYVFADTTVADSGDYTCVIANTRLGASAVATTQVAKVSVLGAPTLGTQPANRTAIVGQTAIFSITAKGLQPFTYVWYKNNVALAASDSDTYTTPVLSLVDNGAQYKCVVTNAVGSTSSDTVTLTVLDVLATFKASAAAMTKGEGVILNYSFRSGTTATLQIGSGTPFAVTSGGTRVEYPSANTTYTLAVSEAGVVTTFAKSVTVQSYTPKHFYAASFGSNELRRYPVDTSIAVYVKAAVGTPVPTGAGPVHVTATPDEKYLYVANHTGASISAYSADAATGVLTALGATPLSTYGAPWCSAVNPAGTMLYVACDGGVEVFNLTAGVPVAAPSLAYPMAGRVKGDLLMHPSGSHLFVLDSAHAKLKMLAIDPATGALSFASEAATSTNPKGLAFDRAASLIFTRGADARQDALGNAYNAAVNVFSIDLRAELVAAKSIYAGYGMNEVQGVERQFVPGMPAYGRRGLAFSRKPGVDQLFSGYTTEQWGLILSQWNIDVTAGTILGDANTPFWSMGSPYWTNLFTGGGDAFVGDRSGTVFIYLLPDNNQLAVYQCDAQGRLSALGSATGQTAYAAGTEPSHGCFRGTLQ